mgnify:CR=1 FL=1
MAYSVFVSRYNNNSSIIKNSFSKASSLGMSAYISDQFRLDMDTKTQYLPKKGRDESEVEFSALILPSALPKKQLNKLTGEDDFPFKRVKDRFVDSKDVVGKENILIQDAEVISHFWSLNDKNIKSIKNDNPSLKRRKTDMRLYNLYLFTSPVAHKHFPKEMGITFRDLRKIEEQAIYAVCDEMFLSKGLPLELGRHQNKENIIHYHIQTPTRVLNYVYQNKEIEFVESDFIAWLSKSILNNTRKSANDRRMKKDFWLNQSKANPSEYNKSRYVSWLRKYEEKKQELEDISDIIAGFKISGCAYTKFKNKYKQNLSTKQNNENESDSLFAKMKGPTELHLDTYVSLDNMKERYAEILNELLIKEGIIKPNTKLYTYVKSTKEFITIKEARQWNVSDDDLVAVNKKLNKIWKMDIDFYNKNLKSKEKKKMKERQRLIVHGLKIVMKQSLSRYKKEIATNSDKADIFVSFWIKKLENIKENYKDFVSSLIDRSIYNFKWKKIVTSEVVFDEKNDIEVPKKFEDFKKVEVALESNKIYELPEEVDEETIEQMNNDIRAIMSQEYVALERTHRKALEQLNYKANLNEFEVSIDIAGESRTMFYSTFHDIMRAVNNQRDESFKEWLESYYILMKKKHPKEYPLILPDDLSIDESEKMSSHIHVLSEMKTSLDKIAKHKKEVQVNMLRFDNDSNHIDKLNDDDLSEEAVLKFKLVETAERRADAKYELIRNEPEITEESIIVEQNDYEIER